MSHNNQHLFEVKRATISLLGKLWEENYKSNLPHIRRTPGVNGLAGRFNEIPAIVIGAGPSLNKAIRYLPLAKDRSVIMTCDAALKALLHHGIVPDIVVNLDPQAYVMNFFDGVDTRGMTLVAPTIVYPELREKWRGNFFYYNKNAPDIPILARISLDHAGIGQLTPGGSVLSVAFDLAFKTEANPIAFVGQDLSYTSQNAYASGGHFGEYTMDEVMSIPGDTIVEEKDIFGRNRKTQKSMSVTKYWFGWAFRTWDPEGRRSIFNCSESGILTECPSLAFGEFISRFCTKNLNTQWILKKSAKVKL